MMAEYGLVPDIFEVGTYSSAEVCSLHLSKLKEALLEHGLVRDFRNGEWRAYLANQTDRWDVRARELVKKLITQKRLVPAQPAAEGKPATEIQWCEEALASHRSTSLTGIIAGQKSAEPYASEDILRPIDKLDTAGWWTRNRESVIVNRTISEYLRYLGLALKHANFLMFVDPHLDPQQRRYRDFVQLLLAIKRPEGQPRPSIQIHRTCCADQRDGPLPVEHWRSAFEEFHKPLLTSGIRVDVFLWDEMHDRFFISDLIGVLMGNGFDVSAAPAARTTWARITRNSREAIQREFDYPNNPVHRLHGRFSIGSGT